MKVVGGGERGRAGESGGEWGRWGLFLKKTCKPGSEGLFQVRGATSEHRLHKEGWGEQRQT